MELTAPEKVGFSSDRLRRLTRRMQGYIDDRKLAGIVTLLARKGQVFHFETFGQVDLESGRAMGPDSIFRIYSLTKPIASVALMMLHEEAAFGLDDPLSAYFPEFADLMVSDGVSQAGVTLESPKSPPTVRQLLSHTAGFGLSSDEMYQDAGILSSDLETMAKKLAKLPLAYQPGSQWRYSVSTDIVGRLVEVLSGQSFDRYLRERIFDPLGMADTGFHVPGEHLDRLAAVYFPSESGGIEPAESRIDRDFGRPPALFSGGAGLVSTAKDYSRFCQMMVNGGNLNGARILGPKTVELMTASHLPPGIKPFLGENLAVHTQGCGFGLGFSIVEDVARNGVAGSVGCYSWGGAANTHFWIDPVEDMYAILMTQLLPFGHYPIRAEFQTLVYQAMVD